MPKVEDIRELVADIANIDPKDIKNDSDLYGFPDFDSLSILSLIVALDDLGISLDQGQVSKVRTFDDLLKLTEVEE